MNDADFEEFWNNYSNYGGNFDSYKELGKAAFSAGAQSVLSRLPERKEGYNDYTTNSLSPDGCYNEGFNACIDEIRDRLTAPREG